MQVVKRIFHFYLNSSVHVAFAASAMAWVTLVELNLAYDKYLLSFIFFATITGYNFVKYFGLAKFHHRRLAGWLKVIQVFSFIAFLSMCYFAIYLEINTLTLIGILGLVTFFYAVPVMIPKHYMFDSHKNLRQIGGLKVYVIALVWTFSTVFLPVVNNAISIDTDIVIIGIQRFCFVLVIMLPFEIRDLNYDSLKLATIPQKIGIEKTKIFGVLLLTVVIMLEYATEELSVNNKVSTLIIGLVTLLFLLFSNKNQSQYYSAFWVESLPIIWLGILLIIS